MTKERHNVLLLIVDDLRPELNCFGKKKLITPNLDRLAQRGLQFNRAYCQMALCMPSRLSTLTGLRPPSSEGPWAVDSWCTAGEPSLPGHLKANGFTTISAGKTYHTNLDDPASWTRRYLDTFYEQSYTCDGYCSGYQLESNKQKLQNFNAGLQSLRLPPKDKPPIDLPAITECADAPDAAYPDAKVAQRSIDEINQMAAIQTPWFLAAGFYRPHLPWAVPKKYWDLYDRDEVDLADNPLPPQNAIGFGDLGDFLHYGDRTINDTYSDLGQYDTDSFPVLDETKQRECVHGYWASVSFVDAQIGKVLDTLEASGQSDNTSIILWGDNGWHLGEHGLWSKATNFEEATRVPLLVSSPRLPTQNRGQSDALVELVDLYPTVCDLAGLKPPPHLEGSSLLPLMTEPSCPWKTVAFSRYGDAITMRTERSRYTRYERDNYQGDRNHFPSKGSCELFDHQGDPGENNNIAGKTEYAEHLRSVEAQFEAGWTGAVPAN